MSVLGTVVDPTGRRVELTAERWAHIVGLANHPELTGLQTEVLQTVAQPARMLAGREPDEVWFYGEAIGPSRWLKVVVLFAQDRGYIVTAFPRRRLP